MKKLILSSLAAICTFAACVEEMPVYETAAPDLHAVTETSEDTKTVLDENNTVLWSEGDQILAFMKSSHRLKYQIKPDYVGKPVGYFSQVATESSAGDIAELDHNVVYYPYSDDIVVEKTNSGYTLEVTLPSEQNYVAESFANGAFHMVAVSDDNEIAFKNICGGIKLQLTGTQSVASVKIEGKNNEKLAGAAVVSAYGDGTVPAIAMESSATNSATLVCKGGIQLSEASATEFIIALPPVKFSKGFTITVTDTEGTTQTIETDKVNEIKRSRLLRMPAMSITPEEPKPADNELWYTADELVTTYSYSRTPFDVSVVSNKYDATTKKGVFTFSGPLTKISDYAFSGTKIKSVTFPSTLKEIGGSVFYNAYLLKEVNMPEGLESIGSHAFYQCRSMVEVVIPNSVKTIGESAFVECDYLEKVTINSCESIAGNVFLKCRKLKEFTGELASSDGRCLVLNGEIKAIAPNGLTEYTIPDEVTKIGESAFYDTNMYNKIETVIVPDTVVEIGKNAFGGLTVLENITLGNGIRSIGSSAFYSQSSSMKNVYIKDMKAWLQIDFENNSSNPLSGGNPANLYLNGEPVTEVTVPEDITVIKPYVFESCKSLVKVNLHDGITEIGQNAFEYCNSLSDITLPSGLTKIKASVFNYCRALKDIEIPQGVTEIGAYAFCGCGFTDLVIPEGVTTIGHDAFSSCSSLLKVVIPSSVTSVNYKAFYYCSNLAEVHLKCSTPPTTDWNYSNGFDNNAEGRMFYVPKGSLSTYKNATGWKTYAAYIVEEEEEGGPDFIYNNVNKGKGVKIDGLYWAPSNAGSFMSHYSAGNVCPEGWRLPTANELLSLVTNRSEFSSGCWFSGSQTYSENAARIWLDASGIEQLRDSGEVVRYEGTKGYYWSSEQTGAYGARALCFTNASAYIEDLNKAEYYCKVRCVADAQ